MDDHELEQIRKARLEQLNSSAGGADISATASQAEQRQQQEASVRQSLLEQILQAEAAERLGRVRLVKQERATEVENRLIMMAQSGQLRQKVTEAQLKDLLNTVASNKEEKIVVSRRKEWDDDDDDLLNMRS